MKEDKEKEIKKNETFSEYKNEHNKYKEKATFPKKGASREEFTLNLLAKFKQKLLSAKEQDNKDEEEEDKDEPEEDKEGEENWLSIL